MPKNGLPLRSRVKRLRTPRGENVKPGPRCENVKPAIPPALDRAKTRARLISLIFETRAWAISLDMRKTRA